jgi:hypothetical protein
MKVLTRIRDLFLHDFNVHNLASCSRGGMKSNKSRGESIFQYFGFDVWYSVVVIGFHWFMDGTAFNIQSFFRSRMEKVQTTVWHLTIYEMIIKARSEYRTSLLFFLEPHRTGTQRRTQRRSSEAENSVSGSQIPMP